MGYHVEQLTAFKVWRQSLAPDCRWGILINADPDAMASALALKRLLHQWARSVDILRINEITRPDNLAMIRYLRIPARLWTPEKASVYDCLGLVDSQPSHNPAFADLTYKLIIDHHPVTSIAQSLGPDSFCDIRPHIGATSTMMAQFIRGLRMRPGPLLATALLYGIRTDTGTFERSGGEEDLRAYQWLSRHAETNLLRRISRSEYLRSWLPYFSRAFKSLIDCRGNGAYVQLHEIPTADLLVAVADFFTKVHGLKWIAVSGVVQETVIVVFRGDGSRDIGRFADACFHDIGSAGGHRNMARAEFSLSAIPRGMRPSEFIYLRLMTRKLRPQTAREEPAPESAAEPAAQPLSAVPHGTEIN